MHLRERLEARVSALADAMARHNSELLHYEVEQIRNEAADQLAEQCRLLAALSMSVATAEAARDRRLGKLERELREHIERSTPEPLPIPRARNGASVAELWQAR